MGLPASSLSGAHVVCRSGVFLKPRWSATSKPAPCTMTASHEGAGSLLAGSCLSLVSHLDQRLAQRCRFWCALLNPLHQFSLLVVMFLTISASAALSLLCFGGPLGLLGIELGHPMSLSRVGCVLDVYLVKGSLCSTCCGIPLIFPLSCCVGNILLTTMCVRNELSFRLNLTLFRLRV